MKIYLLKPNVNNYQSLFFVDKEFREYILEKVRSSNTFGGNWELTKVEYFKDHEDLEKPKSDFPTFSTPLLVFSKRAIEVLKNLLEPNGEILPLICDEDELYAFNLTNIIDALDHEISDIIRFRDGRIMRIENIIFKGNMKNEIENHPIFKLPETRLGDPFVNEEFKKRVEQENLVGFEFIEKLRY